MMRTPLDLMYEPTWRAGPSWIVSEVLVKGPEVTSWSDTSRTTEAPQGQAQGLQLKLGPAPPALEC